MTEERMTSGNVRQACHQFSSNNLNLYSTPQQQPKPTPPPKPTPTQQPKATLRQKCPKTQRSAVVKPTTPPPQHQPIVKLTAPPPQHQSTQSAASACELPKASPIPCQQQSTPTKSTTGMLSQPDSTLLQRHHPNLSFEVMRQQLHSTPLSAEWIPVYSESLSSSA